MNPENKTGTAPKIPTPAPAQGTSSAGVAGPAPTAVPVPPEAPAPAKEMVQIDKAVFEKIVETIDRLEKDNSILKEATGESRIREIMQARAGGALVKNVKLSVVNGKIVIGWKKVKDDVYVDEQNRIHEDQVVKIFFKDGTDSDHDMRAFYRIITKIKGEVIAESKDKVGNLNYKVQLEDGQEIDIDSKFVN